MDSMNMAATSF
jgi:hypothetical protein